MRKVVLLSVGIAAALVAGSVKVDAAVKAYWDQASGKWLKYDTERRRVFPNTPNAAGQVSYGSSPVKRKAIDYSGPFGANTIVIDTSERRLYYIYEPGKALKYGVGVGREGFQWAGTNTISRKAEWPGWTPPPEMIAREKKKGRILPAHMDGGPNNPLGARALYIGGTIYRIHGSNEPWSIGQAVSSGCIRLTNEDVTHLYEQVKVGTRVVVLRGNESEAQLLALAHPPPVKKEPIFVDARVKDDAILMAAVDVAAIDPIEEADAVPTTASIVPVGADIPASLPADARAKDDDLAATAKPADVNPAPLPEEAMVKDDDLALVSPSSAPARAKDDDLAAMAKPADVSPAAPLPEETAVKDDDLALVPTSAPDGATAATTMTAPEVAIAN